MTIKVCKFGGTSLATREQIEKSIDIMLADSSRKCMVVSAPGARYKGDTKMTDLLIVGAKGDNLAIEEVKKRIYDILPDSESMVNSLVQTLDSKLNNKQLNNRMDVLKAFGEYASARMISQILENKKVPSRFLDPIDLDFIIQGFGEDSMPDPNCYPNMGKRIFYPLINQGLMVIPGFYGYREDGSLATLPRNGTDISGAVVARAIREGGFNDELIYENFSDEDGLRRANPQIVEYAEVIPEMTYTEARELAYMGFKLQDGCFGPIVGKNIVLNARNTNKPEHPGTRIVDSRELSENEIIVGVACDKNAVSINMRKLFADKEVGLGEKLFSVLNEFKIPYEHHPTGVDSFSLVIRESCLNGNAKLENVIAQLQARANPDSINVSYLDILAVTGLGMERNLYTNARILTSLAKAGIKDIMGDHGANDLSYNLGVEKGKGDAAVRVIYDEFFPRA